MRPRGEGEGRPGPPAAAPPGRAARPSPPPRSVPGEGERGPESPAESPGAALSHTGVGWERGVRAGAGRCRGRLRARLSPRSPRPLPGAPPAPPGRGRVRVSAAPPGRACVRTAVFCCRLPRNSVAIAHAFVSARSAAPGVLASAVTPCGSSVPALGRLHVQG